MGRTEKRKNKSNGARIYNLACKPQLGFLNVISRGAILYSKCHYCSTEPELFKNDQAASYTLV